MGCRAGGKCGSTGESKRAICGISRPGVRHSMTGTHTKLRRDAGAAGDHAHRKLLGLGQSVQLGGYRQRLYIWGSRSGVFGCRASIGFEVFGLAVIGLEGPGLEE